MRRWQVSVFGLDYSAGRPSHAAMKTAGVEFVCRYIGSRDYTANRSAKWLSPVEVKDLHGAGIAIVTVFETGAKRALGGHAAGVEDGHTAVTELAYCGLPVDMPVYFAVDWDATVSQQAAINGYLDGAASVLGRARVGIYGGYGPVSRALDAGKAKWAWQTYAWSGGRWNPRNHIEQYSNNHNLGGAGVDYDRAMKASFGQWPPMTAPAVKPWPGRYLKVSSPMLHGTDVTYVQRRLNAHKASPALKVDGFYGTRTRDAVRAFQKATKLTVDGVIGPKTWAALAK
jgi:hypothetical protein